MENEEERKKLGFSVIVTIFRSISCYFTRRWLHHYRRHRCSSSLFAVAEIELFSENSLALFTILIESINSRVILEIGCWIGDNNQRREGWGVCNSVNSAKVEVFPRKKKLISASIRLERKFIAKIKSWNYAKLISTWNVSLKSCRFIEFNRILLEIFSKLSRAIEEINCLEPGDGVESMKSF